MSYGYCKDGMRCVAHLQGQALIYLQMTLGWKQTGIYWKYTIKSMRLTH